jgi:hypothetical protein
MPLPYRTVSARLQDRAEDLGTEGTVVWKTERGERGFWLQRYGLDYYLGKTSPAADAALTALVEEI